MKKKRLVLALTAIMAVLSLGLVGCGEEKRGEEVSSEQWDAAFANLNTDNMIAETTMISHKEKEGDEVSGKWIMNEEEWYYSGNQSKLEWNSLGRNWVIRETLNFEQAYKVVEGKLFSYFGLINDKGERGGEWELKEKYLGKEKLNENKESLLQNNYLLFDVYCLGQEWFNYNEEEGFYYKDWTAKMEEEDVKFHQEAVFKNGAVYQIYTTMKSEDTKDDRVIGWSRGTKITFEEDEITLPNEGELMGAILASKEE